MKRLFVHPAIRGYREPLYRMLGDAGFAFLFTMVNTPGSHAGEETAHILRTFDYDWHQCREIKRFPATNFSWDLWRVFRYDTIIFSCLTSVPFLLLAAPLRLLGKRVLLFDETWRYQYEVRRYRRLLPWVRFLVRRCVDAVVPAGSKAADMFDREFGVPRSRMFIAYNTTVDVCPAAPGPVDIADDDSRAHADGHGMVSNGPQGEPAAPNSSRDRPHPVSVLYLGRIVRYKGLDVLIRALAMLDGRPRLRVVGSGDFRTECETLAEQLGLTDRIEFAGDCLAEEASRYYEEADMFVLPSRFVLSDAVNCESWGFTVNEAMSHGLPVVATDAVGAAHDLIRDGDTGMLARENDPASLAEKLSPLVADPELRGAIGERGRLWLQQRCRYDQNFAAVMEAVRYAESGARTGSR
ncbi:MAG TPA: glycosyltransferase family 4 protein [Chthonomonadaceae bacterium]|nr:glycosyltransferase family 4 protein [Chthonomonadaceae bacterium]